MPSGEQPIETSHLDDGLVLRHLSAPYFLATKFEAFKDRGRNDVFVSHDLEDILTVVEGRASLVQEVGAAHDPVRLHIGQAVAGLLALPAFSNALPGLLNDPEREETVFARLSQMSTFAAT